MIYSVSSIYVFGSTYGEGAYGAGAYGEATVQTTTTTTTDPVVPANGGQLANTGFDVLLAVSFACLIIFAALFIRFWKRPKSKK